MEWLLMYETMFLPSHIRPQRQKEKEIKRKKNNQAENKKKKHRFMWTHLIMMHHKAQISLQHLKHMKYISSKHRKLSFDLHP